MFKLRIMLAVFVLTVAVSVSANHKSEHSVKERTAPSGQIFKAGDDVPVAVVAVVESTGPRDGAKVYADKCAMCHAGGIAGAPKTGDQSAWSARVANGEEAMFQNAIIGFTGSAGMMPPRGTCMDCSDDEIKSAVRYLIAQLP